MADMHSFNVEHAEKFGIAEAVLLNSFNFWLTRNRANGRNLHDGLWWTYNSVSAYKELFPYLTESKIRRAIEHLENEGLIVSGNFNKVKFDRTKWYALTEKGWALFGKSICDDGSSICQNEQMTFDQNDEPIPVGTNSQPVSKQGGKRFAPPTREEVEAYVAEKGYSGFNAERFIAYYESNGWRVGRNPMKGWKAAVTGWATRDKEKRKGADDGAILDSGFDAWVKKRMEEDREAIRRGELWSE